MNTDVTTIDQNATAPNAAQKMLENKVHGLCVTDGDDNVLKNVVTSFDMLKLTYMAKLVDATNLIKHVVIKEVVKDQEVISFAPGDTLGTALKIMTEKNIRLVPIVEKGKLVGTVSVNDFLKLLLR